ncbi:hypothetical protein [Hyalangium sp.]|uniref:hypothetical protein n=1 Tax=Hyalangium sp. TaxID=2028555 RepID=UPI002D5ACE25|nr:hypothetical protein [Hyalangium sp.]HYH97320.1 hypothetical protein [Hyalangium sp.]
MGLRKLLRARLRAAAPKQEQAPPVGLQVLFPNPVALTATPLVRLLQEHHPSLAQVRVEVRTGNLSMLMGQSVSTDIGQMARVQWGRHTVLLALFDTRIHAETLERILDHTYQDDDLKKHAEVHTAYAALTYRGEEKDPLEQYVALSLIAVALAHLGASVMVNAYALTCYPAQRLLPQAGEDADTVMRTLPLTALFVGFLRFQVDDSTGVWMRTCGAPQLDLPDLAFYAQGPEESATVFTLFNNLFQAMRSSQVRFSAGDKLDDGERLWRFRKPRASEGFLHSSRMIVMEPEPSAGRLT